MKKVKLESSEKTKNRKLQQKTKKNNQRKPTVGLDFQSQVARPAITKSKYLLFFLKN